MATIPFALSVHHFISTVGADAGFAALIGLAILILLYFAQARETAALRAWAAASAEHVQQLELRIAQLARGQAPSPSASASAPAPAPAPPGLSRAAGASAARAAWAGAESPVGSHPFAAVAVGVAAPAAPAGVGAPALSAATRLIPSPDRDQFSIRAGAGSAVADPPRAADWDGATAPAPPAPPPATAAGGANGITPARPGVPAGAAGTAPRSAGPAGVGATRRSVVAPGGGSRPAGRSRVGRVLTILLGLLALAAVVVILLVVISASSTPGSSSSGSASATTKSKSGPHRRSAAGAAAVTASSVTVAVLNGTSTANLAHTVSTRLGGAGFKPGMTGNASDQTQTTTVVGYLPHDRPAALLVARSLKLGPASIQPADPSNQTAACPASSTPCRVQVVVTVGSDLAANP